MASPDSRHEMLGGLHWHPRLKSLGIPLPQILKASTEGELAYMILERLPGRDLGLVYAELSDTQKRSLADAIADVQRRCAQLPLASGYGYALSYEDPALRRNQGWQDVLIGDLQRSRERIASVGAVDADVADRVQRKVARFAKYLSQVKPTAFLDDTTTKNVLVHHGALSGIVDVDSVCFGDPLFTPALTRMALLARQCDTRYIDYWLEAMQATEEQRAVLDLYTAVFCVNFLGEQGQAFNRDRGAVDHAAIALLQAILDRLLSKL